MPNAGLTRVLPLGAAALLAVGASAAIATPAHAATREQTFTIQRALLDGNSYVAPTSNAVGSMVNVGAGPSNTWSTDSSSNLQPAGGGVTMILGPTNLSTPNSTARLNPGANYGNPEHIFNLYDASGNVISNFQNLVNGQPAVTGYICTTANIAGYNDKACLTTSGGSYNTFFQSFAAAKAGDPNLNTFRITPIPASVDFMPSQPTIPTLNPGASGNLAVRLINNGPDDDHGNIGATMTFSAPNNTTFGSANVGVATSGGGQSVACTLGSGNTTLTCPTMYFQGTMAAGNAATVNLYITASPTAPPGSTQTGGQATTTGVATTNGWRATAPNLANDSAPLSVHITGQPLQITKTATPSGQVAQGSVLTYTVTVNNPNASTVTGASFTDNLTNVLNSATWNNAVTISSGSWSFNSPNFNWNGNIPANSTVTVTYTVTAQ